MTIYNVKSTRISEAAISIPETELDNSTALTLFGRKRLAYGEKLNENLLRLLESFSCPELADTTPATPDIDAVSDPAIFANPKVGQLWYNSTPTRQTLFAYDGIKWVEHQKFGELAANWGVIADGGQIPLPVAPSGRTFDYDECVWIVTPYGYPNTIDYLECTSDEDANVVIKYSLEGDATLLAGYANYMIVAIPENVNLGTLD